MESIRERMRLIRHKILVLSGKGGVGKSTVAANLAVSLARNGWRVGLLDIDIHGPSIPQLLGLRQPPLQRPGAGPDDMPLLLPVPAGENLKVISIGSLLHDPDAAVIWRGPMKYNMIKQFLKDVDWGELDYLVVDSPPGTGDEPLTIVQLLEKPTGAVVVTTPQALAVADVRRCITFCRKLEVPVLGVVENMSGLSCPHCGNHVELFSEGGGKNLAAEAGVLFLGHIPFDPAVGRAGDQGRTYTQIFSESSTGKAFAQVCRELTAQVGQETGND